MWVEALPIRYRYFCSQHQARLLVMTTAVQRLDSSRLSTPTLFDAAARVTALVGGVRPVTEDEHAPCEVKAAPPQEERSDAGVQPARTLGTRGDAW